MLMKRPDGADKPKDEDRLMSKFVDFFERKPAGDVIAKATAALADCVGQIADIKDDKKAAALGDTFEQFREYLEKNVTITAERSAGDNKEHAHNA